VSDDQPLPPRRRDRTAAPLPRHAAAERTLRGGLNARFKRSGHLWGDRFWVRFVDSEEYLVEVCEYVVNNPVRAGLVAHARDWPWSASRYGLD